MAYSRGDVYCYYSIEKKNGLPTFEICNGAPIQFTIEEIIEDIIGCAIHASIAYGYSVPQATKLVECMMDFVKDVNDGTVQGLKD